MYITWRMGKKNTHLSHYLLRDVPAEMLRSPHSLDYLGSDASVQPPEA